MAMTAEEQKLLADTTAAKGVAETNLAAERGKVTELEKNLTAEKAVTTKLTADLDAARAELKTLSGSLSKSTLDALQGVKFIPAEREELDKLVESVGIERVKSLLDKRTDVTLTQPATAGGKPLDDKSKGAPPPVDTSANPDAGSDDFLKSVNEGASKAVA